MIHTTQTETTSPGLILREHYLNRVSKQKKTYLLKLQILQAEWQNGIDYAYCDKMSKMFKVPHDFAKVSQVFGPNDITVHHHYAFFSKMILPQKDNTVYMTSAT